MASSYRPRRTCLAVPGSSPRFLARARTLLRYTLTPLRMIALECGFESTSHFCHAYKRVYGIPPTHERPSRELRRPVSNRPNTVDDRHPTLPTPPITL